MKIKLDARLSAVADLVLAGETAADIGTDHNYLPIYLLQNAVCPSVISSDIAEGPYKNAKRVARQSGLQDKIEVRLGQGLEVLNAGEVATIIIAGMGGRLICDILGSSPKQANAARRLVLQPQKDIPLLRRWLMGNGWCIVAERIVYEAPLYYQVIAAEKGSMQLNDDQLKYGPCLLAERADIFVAYLQQEYASKAELISQIAAFGSEHAGERMAELKAEQAELSAILAVVRD